MQDENIVFGGEKKLKKAIEEAITLFHPKAIGIFATCPVGLIGDDVHAAAREMEEKYPDINIFAFSCEGYKGVSQSAGHHVANNKVFTDVVGTLEYKKPGEFVVNLLGEYNIGGDAFEIERIFERCGITLHATFSGNSEYDEFASAHTADLNMVMCHRSINYMADMMQIKYGIPWIKVNFVGADATSKSLRKIADYFGNQKLKDRVEKVVAEEMVKVKATIEQTIPRTKGKTVMLFVGGSRAHHYQELFTELGMKTLGAGYEFAHRDDYEGRRVLPGIKVDADSRNIEELTVEPDPKRFTPRPTEKEKDRLIKEGFKMEDYKGMMPEMENEAIIIDDLNHHEMEKLIEKYHPDIFCAGVKEKYVVQKYGIPLKQLHSYDYSGPYAGYNGACLFYREIAEMVTSKVWKLVPMPWADKPQLTAGYAWEGAK
jgi:nitrogenase molybdenum-iron protein alpha chain